MFFLFIILVNLNFHPFVQCNLLTTLELPTAETTSSNLGMKCGSAQVIIPSDSQHITLNNQQGFLLGLLESSMDYIIKQ